MSVNSPPIEQQYFARTQTPESPRPVHVPEPAKIPVLLNQMDQASNDLATYNIPTDQNFAHYGDSLENPAYKKSPNSQKDENDPFRDFLRQADSAVANPPEPIVPDNSNTSTQITNQAGLPYLTGQVALSSSSSANGITTQSTNGAQSFGNTNPPLPTTNAHDSAARPLQESAAGYTRTEAEDNRNQNILDDAASADALHESKPEAGVDYQSLLDTIAQSTSTAPTADNVTALTTEPAKSDSHTSSLPSFPGLPPKPPPLETQNMLTVSIENALPQQQPYGKDSFSSQQNAANGFAPHTNQATFSTSQAQNGYNSGLPTNPFDTGMTNQQAIAMHMQNNQKDVQVRPESPASRAGTEPSDRPWSPRTQARYDEFLENERRYVTEGIWDRFPLGSRLFVGNLPSEKVTKRDLFHRFNRFGRLAQISIKQAYGFVQYHDAESCKAALDAEQGVELRGRAVHLEISKPQKGSKASQQQGNKNQNRKRSRSPQRRSYSDFRDEPSRKREEYRSRRSPSPPRHRRDDRAMSRDDRRSPMYSSNYSTPQFAAYDDEASLPYPRRDPRYVPDVQIIVLDTNVPQAFVNWIEDGLKRKNLSVNTTILNQRTPLAAVVKRQIVEGVQAVVKLAATHQTRSKIPLQVFDRSAGTSNVTFNEYVDLDVPVAADVVLQARQKERAGFQPPRPPYPPSYPPPQSPYQQQMPSTPWQPPQQNMPQYAPPPQAPLPPQYGGYPQSPYPPQSQQSFRPPQPPQMQYPTPNSATSQPPNLQELLANLKGGSNAPPTPQSAHSAGQPYTPYGQPPPPQYPPHYPLQQYGGYVQPQHQYQQPPPPPQQQQQQQQSVGQQNVQYILDQMARNR